MKTGIRILIAIQLFLFIMPGFTLAQETLSPVVPDYNDTAVYIPVSQFTHAGVRRYTMDGSLPFKKTNIKVVPMAVAAGLLGGFIITTDYIQQHQWWSGQRRSFHFTEDWVSALQVDKFAHAYSAYSASYLLSEGLLASGVNWDDATLYGSVLGLLYQTQIEVQDGFARDWGFSPSDFYFDVLGSVYFLAQHHVPYLQNFQMKWQYMPTRLTGRPSINNRPTTFVDDYNSASFWISADVYNLLPDAQKKYWPKWLMIAAGYGGDAIDVSVDQNGPPDQLASRRFMLSLDYNMSRVLPEGNFAWNWFVQMLHYVKLPSPVLEFSGKTTKFYLLYPFSIRLGDYRL